MQVALDFSNKNQSNIFCSFSPNTIQFHTSIMNPFGIWYYYYYCFCKLIPCFLRLRKYPFKLFYYVAGDDWLNSVFRKRKKFLYSSSSKSQKFIRLTQNKNHCSSLSFPISASFQFSPPEFWHSFLSPHQWRASLILLSFVSTLVTPLLHFSPSHSLASIASTQLSKLLISTTADWFLKRISTFRMFQLTINLWIYLIFNIFLLGNQHCTIFSSLLFVHLALIEKYSGLFWIFPFYYWL